jgi:hypothetical protein
MMWRVSGGMMWRVSGGSGLITYSATAGWPGSGMPRYSPVLSNAGLTPGAGSRCRATVRAMTAEKSSVGAVTRKSPTSVWRGRPVIPGRRGRSRRTTGVTLPGRRRSGRSRPRWSSAGFPRGRPQACVAVGAAVAGSPAPPPVQQPLELLAGPHVAELLVERHPAGPAERTGEAVRVPGDRRRLVGVVHGPGVHQGSPSTRQSTHRADAAPRLLVAWAPPTLRGLPRSEGPARRRRQGFGRMSSMDQVFAIAWQYVVGLVPPEDLPMDGSVAGHRLGLPRIA